MTTSFEATMLSRMAEEARSIASDMRRPGQKLYLLQIAARYDALAKLAEAERSEPHRTDRGGKAAH
jgi:hypothetical protein